jgi:type VI secretion system secreted protein Hcp
MPAYMKMSRDDHQVIRGDVTEAEHVGWIEIASFRFTPPASKPPSPDREGDIPATQDVSIAKAVDVATPLLQREAQSGAPMTVNIDFVRSNAGKPEVYLSYTLVEAMVSSDSISSAGDRPMEALSFSFAKITIDNAGMGADVSGPAATVGWYFPPSGS